MMKVKTLVENVEKGYEEVLKKLDEGVTKLGEVNIKNIADYFYPALPQQDGAHPGYIARVITYSEKERWKATLDTDIMEFLMYETRLSDRTIYFLQDIYKKDVRLGAKSYKTVLTLKDLIELGYDRLSPPPRCKVMWEDGRRLGPKSRDELNNLFTEYGLPLIRPTVVLSF